MSARLTCAFGSLWGAQGCGPCAKCQRYAEQLAAEFQRDVFFGKYDATGHTPAERAKGRR